MGPYCSWTVLVCFELIYFSGIFCRLEDLWLNNNNITTLDGIAEAVAGCRENLTTIYLERNPCVCICTPWVFVIMIGYIFLSLLIFHFSCMKICCILVDSLKFLRRICSIMYLAGPAYKKFPSDNQKIHPILWEMSAESDSHGYELWEKWLIYLLCLYNCWRT